MRKVVALTYLVLVVLVASPAAAQDGSRPEAIVEKMAFKLVRGVTNIATSVVELPKQSYLMVRDRGAIGYAVGPLKGVGMTLYRGLIGTVETALFMVPQPGYYDPMINPEFVWQGWEVRRNDQARLVERAPEAPAEGKGE